MKLKFSILIIILSLFSQTLKAEPSREFLMSCLYGTLAGTIIGTASLAMAERPTDKMQRIARGASLGLYSGILLGLYVVYAVPDEDEQLNEVLGSNSVVYPIMNDDFKVEGAGFLKTFYF